MTAPSARSTWTWPAFAPALVTIVLGGVFLTRSSIWTDEAATWATARMSLSSIFSYTLHTRDAVLLPYYLFMHVWLGASQQLWWMRLPSLIAAAAATWALTRLARRWLEPTWAILAGILVAVNPLYVRWSIEARPYAIATLFAVLSTAALATAVERGGWRNWTAYGALGLCLALFHLFGILVLIAQAVTIVVAKRRSAWLGQAVGLAAVIVLIGPLAVAAARQTAQVSWIPRPGPATFFTALTDVSGGHTLAIGLVASCAVVLVAAFRSPARNIERLPAILSVTWALLPPVVLVAASFVHPVYVDRYVLVSVPAVALTEAAAGAYVWRWLVGRERIPVQAFPTPRPGPKPAPGPASGTAGWSSRSPGAVALVVVMVLVPLWLARTSFEAVRQPYFYDDYRTAAAVLDRDLDGSGAAILVVKAEAGQGFAFYARSGRLRRELLHPVATSLPRIVHRQSSIPAGPGTVGIIWSRDPAPRFGCPGVVAIGWHPISHPSFEFDGSTCRLSDVRHFGLVWVGRGAS